VDGDPATTAGGEAGWKMYFDGFLNLKGAGVGVLFISP
jgi:hypothetical protein